MTVGGDSPLERNGDKPEGGWTGVSWGDRTHELRYASLNEGIRSIISFCCESVRIEINKTPYPLTLLTVPIAYNAEEKACW